MSPSITQLRNQNPDLIPVKCVASKKSQFNPLLKDQFLVPKETRLGVFAMEIRKRLKITSQTSIVFFINNEIPPVSKTFDELDQQYSKDGLLTLVYAGENVFG